MSPADSEPPVEPLIPPVSSAASASASILERPGLPSWSSTDRSLYRNTRNQRNQKKEIKKSEKQEKPFWPEKVSSEPGKPTQSRHLLYKIIIRPTETNDGTLQEY
jgi:hypothetical protein